MSRTDDRATPRTLAPRAFAVAVLMLVVTGATACHHQAEESSTVRHRAADSSARLGKHRVVPGAAPKGIRLRVVYSVGSPATSCPAGGRCWVTQGEDGIDVRVASYPLRCPRRGSLQQERCAAASGLLRLQRRADLACPCPPPAFDDRLYGFYHRRWVSVSLTACAVCALGHDAAKLVRVLTPHA